MSSSVSSFQTLSAYSPGLVCETKLHTCVKLGRIKCLYTLMFVLFGSKLEDKSLHQIIAGIPQLQFTIKNLNECNSDLLGLFPNI